MSYAIRLTSRAARELAALPKEIVGRIDSQLADLAENPRPHGCKKLKSHEANGWRIRIGSYRLLYTIDDTARRVVVYRIAHRREVYQ